MPSCPSCGTANAPDARFCGECGYDLSKAPVAASGPPMDAPFAATSMGMSANAAAASVCPKCGAAMDKDAAFCGECGARATAPVAASAPLADAAPFGATNMGMSAGAAAASVCPKCGAAMDKDAAFCGECGARATAPVAASAPLADEPFAATSMGMSANAAAASVCPKCGAAIDKDAAFCGDCGARATAPVAASAPLADAATFAATNMGMSASAAAASVCPKCGAAMDKDAAFCGECGAREAPVPQDEAPTVEIIPSVAALPSEAASAPAYSPAWAASILEAAPAFTGPVCSKCGESLPPGVVFCSNCGARTESAAASVPIAAAIPPPAATSRAGPGKLLLIGLVAFPLMVSVGGGALLWYRNRTERAPAAAPAQSAEVQQPAPDQPSAAAQQPPAAPPADAVQDNAASNPAIPPPAQEPAQTEPAPVPQSAPPAQARTSPPQTRNAVPAPTPQSAPSMQSAAEVPAPADSAPPLEQSAPPPSTEPDPSPARPAPAQPMPSRNTPPPRPVYSGPQSGWLTWTGKLGKNDTLTIDGGSASTGSLVGALPGVPVDVTVDVQNIGLVEEPRPTNGFRRITLRSYGKHDAIRIHWTVRR